MSTIPEAAIEAAAKACWDDCNSDPWPDGDECDKDVFIRDARVALEAALPHLIRAELDSIIATFVPSAQTLLDTAGMLTASTAKRQAWADGAQFIADIVCARAAAIREGKA